jgi:hypothetical protein
MINLCNMIETFDFVVEQKHSNFIESTIGYPTILSGVI